MKRFVPALLITAAVLAWNFFYGGDRAISFHDGSETVSIDRAWQSGQQVQSTGEVIRILADDNDGSRHQRFIVRLSSGRTLLIAHNIDLAPRVQPIAVGDTVSLSGEYEWNGQGGVIHWTHGNPQNRHPPGWIEHKGRKYR